MNQSSNKRHHRARVAWLLLGAAGCAAMFTGACSDPFESCEERRACEPGGAAGTAGKNAAGDGGLPGSTAAGAGGAGHGDAGGEPMQNEAGERSVGGSPSGGSPSGGSPGDAGAGGAPVIEQGGAPVVEQGGAPVIEQGGAAGASQGGTTAQGGTTGGSTTYGGPCKPAEAKLCSAVFPDIVKCGGKRITCSSTGYWPPPAEACVAESAGCTTDDNDCNGVPDNKRDECASCQLGTYNRCYLGNDSECAHGVSMCVQGSSGTYFADCAPLPTEGVKYPLNRLWCADESLVGKPCISSDGQPATITSKCATSPTTCGYLYCVANP